VKIMLEKIKVERVKPQPRLRILAPTCDYIIDGLHSALRYREDVLILRKDP
jgi:hypothetical protein